MKSELFAALDEIDIEDYLDREGVDYQPSFGTRGLQLNLTDCPVCGGGGRKTYVNAETGLGNCFHGSCNAKFNRFSLFKAISGLSGADFAAHIIGIAENYGWMPKKERKEISRGALVLPSKLRPIPEDGRHLRYLEERGVTPESALYFQLTYCHGGWWGYKVEGEEKWVSYDKRIIIPIANLEGELVSFQGRDISGVKLPKYLFPTGFAVAGSHLYNAQNFEEGTHTHLIVGEGAFDAIAIHQALQGHTSCNTMMAVATFGMHLSDGPEGQITKFIRLKERGVRTVTMMWDSESSAMTGAVKAGLQLVGLGLKVLIAELPAGCDPAQDKDKNPVPPGVVRQAIFNATFLTRLTAIKLLRKALKIAEVPHHP